MGAPLLEELGHIYVHIYVHTYIYTMQDELSLIIFLEKNIVLGLTLLAQALSPHL